MLEFIKYENKYEDRWDRFVLEKSRNGTFLQTRRFLSYHPTERFTDASLMVLQGGNIAAVIPSCEIVDDVVFFHQWNAMIVLGRHSAPQSAKVGNFCRPQVLLNFF